MNCSLTVPVIHSVNVALMSTELLVDFDHMVRFRHMLIIQGGCSCLVAIKRLIRSHATLQFLSLKNDVANPCKLLTLTMTGCLCSLFDKQLFTSTLVPRIDAAAIQTWPPLIAHRQCLYSYFYNQFWAYSRVANIRGAAFNQIWHILNGLGSKHASYEETQLTTSSEHIL